MKVGEITIVTAVAGFFNVPLVLVTGDEAACLEAKSLILGLEPVAVKKRVTHEATKSITPIKTRKMIKEGVKDALTRVKEVAPLKIKTPVELMVEFTEEDKGSAEYLAKRLGVKQVNARTIKIEGGDMFEVLQRWWM